MIHDSLNLFLVGVAILLLVIAAYRFDQSQASLPGPKNPIGF
jgi:uncharacterized membrane protein YidH (DUF202 family)